MQTTCRYPGHIARAERTLQQYLKLVDVVIEVRDARIPVSTTHPLVPEWVGSRPLIVVFNRVDVAPAKAVDDWRR
jgi:ribosome biogenesis GTPase A